MLRLVTKHTQVLQSSHSCLGPPKGLFSCLRALSETVFHGLRCKSTTLMRKNKSSWVMPGGCATPSLGSHTSRASESALIIRQQQWLCSHPGQDTPTCVQFTLTKSTLQSSAAGMNRASLSSPSPVPSNGGFIRAQTRPIGLSVKKP